MVKRYNTFESQLVVVEHSVGSVISLTNEQKLSLYKKSQKSGISTDILEEVYHRGYSIWKSTFSETPEQFAFERVNSFIAGGFAAILDEDLIPEVAKEFQNPTGGLNQDGRNYYNKKHGSHLQAPVTTPPSEIKAGSKDEGRRNSFCARMSHVKGPKYKPNGEPTRKTLSLRKWNCEETELEEKRGLWDNIHAKQERIKHGSGEHMRKPGAKGAPTAAALKNSQSIKESEDGKSKIGKTPGHMVSMEQPWHPEDPNAGHRKAFQKKMEKEQKEREKMQERYEGAEKSSKDFRKPNSRFVGSEELTKVYDKMTPKESTLMTIKRVISEGREDVRRLQKTLGMSRRQQDGIIGPKTNAAIANRQDLSQNMKKTADTPVSTSTPKKPEMVASNDDRNTPESTPKKPEMVASNDARNRTQDQDVNDVNKLTDAGARKVNWDSLVKGTGEKENNTPSYQYMTKDIHPNDILAGSAHQGGAGFDNENESGGSKKLLKKVIRQTVNELSVPLGTTGKRDKVATPLVGIRMADGTIKRLPPGKSGSSGGGSGSAE